MESWDEFSYPVPHFSLLLIELGLNSNKGMKRTIILFFVFSCYGILSAQQDTIVVLDDVTIVTTRVKELSSGTKLQNFDSLTKAQHSTTTLADLLSNESSMFVKTYGQGSLATSSLRGGSASQTAILWNGINVNSSMNGILDFSLVPNLFFEDIGIQYGGGSALWGSGAFGGAIHLNNSMSLKDTVVGNFGASIGSFGLNTQQSKVIIGTTKRAFSFGFSRSNSTNDFVFYDEILGKDSLNYQRNAGFLSTGVAAGFKSRIKKNSLLKLNAWYQLTSRELPPTISQLQATATTVVQKDKAVRATAMWKYFKGKNKFRIQVAYFREKIYYSDSTSGIYANNLADQFIGQLIYDHRFSKQLQLNTGVLNTFVVSNTSNYLTQIQENRIAVFTSLKMQSKNRKLKSVLSARQAVIQRELLTPTFALQGVYTLTKWLDLKASGSTVYRAPTLNDQYWNPGGNPLLQPESGYSIEGGMLSNFLIRKKLVVQCEWTLFNKQIDNWIAWVPGGAFWTPQNFKQVWSRGVETLNEIKYEKKEWKFQLKIMTNYVLSTNEKVVLPADQSLNKQLIYVPRYTGFAKISIGFKQIMCSYRHNYTGYTFTSSDNASYIPPYHLGAFYFSWNAKLKNLPINLFMALNNAWNESYQRVLNRPMPLANYSFGVQVNFGKKVNNKIN